MGDDDAGIDSYITLYFQDLIPHAGPAEDHFVASLEPYAVDALNELRGVKVRPTATGAQAPDGAPSRVQGRISVEIVAKTSQALGRLLASPDAVAVEATAREPWIPVLLQLRRVDRLPQYHGLELGSRLGTVVTATATKAAIAELRKDPNVVAVEASRGGVSECVRSMPWTGATAVHGPPLSEDGQGAIVAVIDEGCDVLHKAFRDDDRQSRIRFLWDQRDPSGPTPNGVNSAVFEQNYGTLHTRSDLTGYIRSDAVGKRLGRDPGGHGTHVASIAAGSPLPGTTFPGGMARKADLVVVIPKLSASTGDPQSIGYSKSHVDALAFVRAAADEAGMPVVVNVSLGMNAGAHDGCSLVELAFDAFSGGGRDPGYAVVKSAGNEFGYGGHAYIQAFTGGITPIEWRTDATARREDYLEFWFRSCDDLAFTLVAPGGLRCTADRANPKGVAHDDPYTLSIYLDLTRLHADNGDSRLVALARNNQGKPVTSAGTWRLKIEGRTVLSDGGVHGWVERDRARAVHFFTGSADELTLSIPGTARTVIAVGACEARDPLALSTSSSRGPTRDLRLKPELVAPGVDIVAALSGTADGLVSMTGTSMASPHVAGAVALLMARRERLRLGQLNAAQIRAALVESVARYSGRWQPGFGGGRLDVERLLHNYS